MACALPWATLPASTLLKTNSLSRALPEKRKPSGFLFFSCEAGSFLRQPSGKVLSKALATVCAAAERTPSVVNEPHGNIPCATMAKDRKQTAFRCEPQGRQTLAGFC